MSRTKKKMRDRWSTNVLNNDTLTLIFNEMSLKNVFRLQRVSKQFKECAEESLKQRKPFSLMKLEEDLNQYVDYLCTERGDSKNKYSLNDLRPGVFQVKGVFLLMERTNVLKSITSKCISIEFLTFRDCFLSEIVIDIFNENLKNLKCLSLIECYLS